MRGCPVTEALLATLLAFALPQDFQAPVAVGGGGGRRFTGSPTSKWDCGVCHDPKADLALTVKATPDSLFTDGYVPGTTYTLDLSISDAAPKSSAFAVEIARGALVSGPKFAGTFTAVAGQPKCKDGLDVVEIQDGAAPGEAAQARGCIAGVSTWQVTWTAPDKDLGTATLYASAVVGDNSGNNLGDASASVLIGIPSPATKVNRNPGCGAGAFLLLPLGLVLWRRKRLALVGMLVLVPFAADAKPKPKKAPPPVVAPAPAPAPVPVPAPAPAPLADPAPAPVAAPAPPAEQPPSTSLGEQPPAVVEDSEALHVDVSTGAAGRSLELFSNSYGRPVSFAYGHPIAAVAIAFRPMRLLRVHALEGLEIEGAYQRGWVIEPVASTTTTPADGKLTLGYVLELGPVAIAPRAVFRMLVGGVDKNALFDDPWFQSVGGELGLGLTLGPVTVSVRPQVAKVLDTGTLSATGYGKAKGGLSFGGDAGVGVRLGKSGFTLGLSYRFTRTSASWAGNGERALGPLTAVDQTQQGSLFLRYAR